MHQLRRIWYGCVTLFTAHPVIMFVCSVIISSQLFLHSRSKGRLSVAPAPSPAFSEGQDASTSTSGTSSSKELQASVTVLTLAILQCIAYFPAAVGCMFYCFLVNTPGRSTSAPEYYAEVVLFYKLSHIVFTIGHVWNLYVYILKIPTFRRELFHSLCSGLIFTANDSSFLSTSRTFTNKAQDFL